MPQLDFLIVASQTYLIVILIVTYLIYIKYVLPWISIYIKLDTLITNKLFSAIIRADIDKPKFKELHDLNHDVLVKLSNFYKFFSSHKKETVLDMPILEEGLEASKNAKNISK